MACRAQAGNLWGNINQRPAELFFNRMLSSKDCSFDSSFESRRFTARIESFCKIKEWFLVTSFEFFCPRLIPAAMTRIRHNKENQRKNICLFIP